MRRHGLLLLAVAVLAGAALTLVAITRPDQTARPRVTQPTPAPARERAGPESEPAPGSPGIAAGHVLTSMSDADLGRLLDEMRRAGAVWIRFDVTWSRVQAGGPNSWDWTRSDRVVAAIAARGMRSHLILGYTPKWARCATCTSDKFPPTDPGAFAAFARAAAERYAAIGVHTYEIWNEPNTTTFWKPGPDAAAYTSMLKLAYPAIKQGDPRARVLTGGTAPAECCGNVGAVDFLREIYRNGGSPFFDDVAHHPYVWPAYPGERQTGKAWAEMADTRPSLRSVMVANGDRAKRIWLTEFGAPTNGPNGSYVSEAEQAKMVLRAFAFAKAYPWAGPLEWYSHRDLGSSRTTRENFFGLLRNDWSEKPAFAAYQQSAR
jgi:hypothetical protein